MMRGSRTGGSRPGSARLLLAAIAVMFVPLTNPARADEAGAPTVTRHVVPSFDGTPIVANLFVPPGVDEANPAPLVLKTHGWGGRGEQDASLPLLDELLDAGYVVLTWDQRGFGCSGGVVEVDKPEAEGHDVAALIDWAVLNAPVRTDAADDPIIGMAGGSYAGGVQAAAAAVDPRIDALTPEASWSDLRYSMYSGDVPNLGWATLLWAAGSATTGLSNTDPRCPTFPSGADTAMNPLIHQAVVEGGTTGRLSPEVVDFFGRSSLDVYGEETPVAVPTLVIQGSTDTLFDLTDGYGIVEHVRAQGQDSQFLIYCGGHVSCPTSYGTADDAAHVRNAILHWFDRYLRGDETVDTGPPVEYRTNDAEWRTSNGFPPSNALWLRATGTGSVVSVPSTGQVDPGGAVEQITASGGATPDLPITSSTLTDPTLGQAFTVEVAEAVDGPLEVLGIPEVDLAVTGTGAEIVLMAKLVDREAGTVVNLQEGAVRVPLAGGLSAAAASGVPVPMPGVAYSVPAGHHLDLEISTASLMHQNARLPASADVVARVSVPVVAATAPARDTGDAPRPPGRPDPRPVADTGSLPATGGSGATGTALAVTVVGLLAWRVTRHRRA